MINNYSNRNDYSCLLLQRSRALIISKQITVKKGKWWHQQEKNSKKYLECSSIMGIYRFEFTFYFRWSMGDNPHKKNAFQRATTSPIFELHVTYLRVNCFPSDKNDNHEIGTSLFYFFIKDISQFTVSKAVEIFIIGNFWNQTKWNEDILYDCDSKKLLRFFGAIINYNKNSM